MRTRPDTACFVLNLGLSTLAMDITGFIGEYLDFQPWSTIAMLCMLLLGTMALATRTTGYLGEGLYRDVPIVNPGKRSF